MTYDPLTYWTAAGRDRENAEHESHFVRTEVFAHQEERLISLLRTLEFRSVLEVGCGWGRITKLVHDEWPKVPYLAIDISPERLASVAEKVDEAIYATSRGVWLHESSIQDFQSGGETFDLVLAVETLMHVPPPEIAGAVDKLLALSSKYVVSLDWAVPLNVPIAYHNFLHDYVSLYGDRLVRMEQIGLQAICLAEVGPGGLAADGRDDVAQAREVDDWTRPSRAERSDFDRPVDGVRRAAGRSEIDPGRDKGRRVGKRKASLQVGNPRSQLSLPHREVER